ncbi:MAG: EAL domain-containing protein [Rhodocyclaceae bacterium]|nr:EAL domain-containing protein [Rhodocyclaceae bacterium]
MSAAAEPQADPQQAHQAELRVRLVDATYRQNAGGLPMTALAVVGLVAIHWLSTGHWLSPPWLAAMTATLLLRLAVLVSDRRSGQLRSLPLRWHLFVGPLLVTSLLWGLIPVLVFPVADAAETLALVCILSGMAGGAATVLAPLTWPARVYIGCMLLPAAVMIYPLDHSGPVLASLGVFFTIVMMVGHSHAHRLLVHALGTLIDNEALLENVHHQSQELARLNRQLLESQQSLRNYNARLENEVSERTARMRLASAAIENTAEGVAVMDPQGRIVEVNPAFSRITGYRADEAVGRPDTILHCDRQDPAFHQRMREVLASSGRWEGELWSRRRDGSVFLERRTVDAVRAPDGRITHLVSIFNDITDTYRKDQQLLHQALHDPLTGLGNRSLLAERLELGIAHARRDGRRLGLLYMDLDQFKSVNDSLGHPAGDRLLQAVATRLAGRLRASDTLARVGGDEFVVLMDEFADSDDCARLATQLLASLEAPFELQEATIHVRTSLGIAVYPQDGQDGDTLLKNADMALYAAKAAGRNTYAFFDQALAERARERLDLETALRRAIDGGELSLHYQALVHSHDQRRAGFEALLRWNRPGHGPVPPARFIGIAEDCGLIGALGAWVLEEVCRQLAEWHASGHGWQKVAVNISTRQIMNEDLPSLVASLTDLHGIPAGTLEMEVTESFVMTEPARSRPVLEALRTLGVAIAIDDFGTGHSSLAYLRQLPADVLKIDRSFVVEAGSDAGALSIIHTIVSLSRSFGLRVVAEGIETAEQAQLLRHAGCDLMQGYHFARPVPARDIAFDPPDEQILRLA